MILAAKPGLGQLVADDHGMGTHDFFVHEPIQLIAEHRRVVEAQKDRHVRFGSVEHPVGYAFGFSTEYSGAVNSMQADAILGGKGVADLRVHVQHLAHGGHFADFAGFQNGEQFLRAVDRFLSYRLRIFYEGVVDQSECRRGPISGSRSLRPEPWFGWSSISCDIFTN